MRKLKMSGRDHTEKHRAATPLELLFDLVYVVAIAAATSGLHHAIAGHHIADGVFAYLVSFFAIWLAWINYAWFASAYDTDDATFRLYTFIQIFGSLVLAVGITYIFNPEPSFTVAVVGYVVMRVAMVLQWLRAAKEDPSRRKTNLRYALSIAFVQTGWVAWLFLPLSIQRPIMPLLMLAELLTPLYAERAQHTPWHPHHIAERYGLLTIIVLGEGILGTVKAIGNLVHNESETLWFSEVFTLGLGAAALIFALWWSYFQMQWGHMLENRRNRKTAFLFGYAHYLVFVSLAGVGAGLELVADAVSDVRWLAQGAHPVSPMLAIAVLSISLSIYMLVISVLRITCFAACRYGYVSLLLSVVVPALPVATVYFGLPLQYALMLTVLAPVGFVLICSGDRKREMPL